MKIKLFTQEKLSAIFFPEAFWNQVEKFYAIPKEDMEKFKNQDALLVYVLQIQQYQHGLIEFVSAIEKQLPEEARARFRSVSEAIFATQVKKHIDMIAGTCRGNLLNYFEQQYKKNESK